MIAFKFGVWLGPKGCDVSEPQRYLRNFARARVRNDIPRADKLSPPAAPMHTF